MEPKGTILFTTIGRPYYGFDSFFIPLSTDRHHPASAAPDIRLTDGVSVNFNAQFVDDDKTTVFISERSGSPRIYLTRPGNKKPELLISIPDSLFHDRPVIKNNVVYFVSAHENPGQLFKSWSAVYCSSLIDNERKTIRLTPPSDADYSPALSETGSFIAVASYGPRPWAGDFHELETNIVVFRSSDPNNRVLVAEKGGWPTWSGDDTIFFHHQADDGWWSIFRVDITIDLKDFTGLPSCPTRVTPPGVHCFTPAAFHDGKRIAVATRRRETTYRHIEVFDLQTETFYPLTESVNPSFHHYNPFVSPDSMSVGYHRFRGESEGESTVPHLDQVSSPSKSLRLVMVNGAFPSSSPAGDFIAINLDLAEGPNGGVKIIKSDGSKRWTLIKNRIAFYNSWSPTEKHVVYTSLGSIFQTAKHTVQIARIEFEPSSLTIEKDEIPCKVKILTREDTGNNAFPACSPDGKTLVFRSGRSGHKNLYILDAVNGETNGDENVARQITNGPWIDTMPSWSPDGELIAFSSNMHNPANNAAFSIYLIKPDGSGLQRVKVAGSNDVDRERINHVCFSRDGKWLLFTANLCGVLADPVSFPNQFQPYGDLYVARLDGSELKRLTWNGYENGTPAWQNVGDDDVDVDLGSLCLKSDDGDKLTGQFVEPLWISCDI